ncbi:DUF3891 family protein [Marinithermofilum abyssi]|uniref:DUF3891 family protein n=1 Tax=Marinithermofilum abyssi TaxID=1571185 RepID=UPI00166D39FF|nr:DUF3891 family protein [Marinithermofilum abyssi]
MIRRNRKDGYFLIRQHDHGWISGDMADHWRQKPAPLRSTRLAIRYHDVGWESLDDEVCWDRETNRPYSFEDYPLEPKLSAYRRGIDRVEAMDPYAAVLCSLHYASFFQEEHVAKAEPFLKREKERRERLLHSISEADRKRLPENLRLLKVCDDLSLFVCLNEPGENTHPWFQKGIRWGNQWLKPVWEGAERLRFEPNPFDQAFDIRVPYQVIDFDGERVETGQYRIQLRG